MGKKEDKEEYEFKVPDFDEDAFIHKEMVSFRTTVIVFVWGLAAALVSWGLHAALGGAITGWYLGLLVVAAFGLAIKPLYKVFKVDTAHFGRREWLGGGFLLFFTWLAFFILFVNPPFSDHADPVVEVFVSPGLQQAGGDVTIDLFVVDNHRVRDFQFELRRGGTVLATEADLSLVQPDHYRFVLEAPVAGTYDYTAGAVDMRGNTGDDEGTFVVSAQAIRVTPSGGTLLPGSNLVVSFASDFEPLNVFLCLHPPQRDCHLGPEAADPRIYLRFTAEHQGWTATSAYRGWQEGENTFSVVAETDHHYFGPLRADGAEVIRGPFNLTVPDGGGTFDPAVPLDRTEVSPHFRALPGGPVAAALAVVGGLAVLARRRGQGER